MAKTKSDGGGMKMRAKPRRTFHYEVERFGNAQDVKDGTSSGTVKRVPNKPPQKGK